MKNKQPDYKQYEIIKTILRRIASKEYTDRLPRTVDLVEEFQANPKTIDKAIRRLMDQGILDRRRRGGTRIIPMKQYADPVIEVLFDGFAAIFYHPFWRYIWESLFQELSAAGYRAVLTELISDPETGLINFNRLTFFPAVGRVVLGSYEKLLLDRTADTKVPFITACDPLDESIPQVSFDFTEGINDAVEYLHEKGCRKIGFIGQTQSLIHLQKLNKFHAYLSAIQKYSQVDPACIGSTRPTQGGGAIALQEILQSTIPDALIVASDHQLPEILQLLEEREIKIPVIGCDGLELPSIPANRPLIRAPLRECGRLVAEKIILAIHNHRKPKSVYLKAQFEPGE